MSECGVKGVGGGGVVEWKVCCVRCQVGGRISSEVRDDDEVETGGEGFRATGTK